MATMGSCSLAYDSRDGTVRVRATVPITSIQLESESAIFIDDAAANLDGPFDVSDDDKIFKSVLGDSFQEVDFGPVLPPGLSIAFLEADVWATGSLVVGGHFGNTAVTFVPEPLTHALFAAGFAVLLLRQRPAERGRKST